ncbi:MAG TPA: hypothetical protein VFN56_00410 [Candidatus Saccharimonadales bacterium]|nr:hypothetical protein [Candidatus Saccharimonadales bacterium]
MTHMNQRGASSLLLPFIVVLLLFVAAAGFGFWAFQGRQDYKNNVDAKIVVAQKQAAAAQSKVDANTYAELEKQPFVTYTGPEAYGSIQVVYPKTWSSYVDTSGATGNQTVVDGYFYPGTVPSITSGGTNFALRVQVLSQNYSDVLASMNNSQSKPTISAYSLPKVPSVVGVRVKGAISDNKTGDMIILPLRDKTVEVWTEGNQFESDFSNTILPNMSFSP